MSQPTQHAFAAALLDAEMPTPDAVTAHTAQTGRRFAVYRNNVVSSLIAALRTRFPVVDRLVGDAFFTAMARVFVTAHPPRSPLLMTYGDDFGDFIADFPPCAELPYLAGVARLEAARTRAYHAADAVPVDPVALQSLPPAALPGLRLTLHPSCAVLRSAHPVVTIWAMNADGRDPGAITDWSGEDALIARPQMEVEVRTLPPGGAAFLTALGAGHSLAVAARLGADDDVQFDLSANLAGLLGSGLVTGVQLPEPPVDAVS